MRYITTLLLLIFCSSVFATANITARLDRNPVSLDESFHLVYEADSTVDDDPDFSALTQDFEILSSAQSTNMRSINGNWTLKKSWDLTLISRQAGTFTIPSIPFGSDIAPAVRITVKPPGQQPAPGGNTGSAARYFIEASTSTREARVQSEIIYTVRLLSNVQMRQTPLGLSTSDTDAIIEPLSEGTTYETTRNGVRYGVFEKKFAVYPQHSGTLVFKPFSFDVRIAGNNTRSLFDRFMQPGTRKRLRSNSLKVEILPRPDRISANDWLPAEQVSITDDWSDDVTQLKVGEPVTRTLTIKAIGQMAEQLHDPELGEIDGLKLYPDKASTENFAGNQGITGKRVIKVAIIPSRAGTFTVPEIRLPWWNTKTGKEETVVVAGRQLVATGAATTLIQPLQKADRIANTTQPAVNNQPAPALPVSAGYWPWISLALAIGWISTILLMLRRPARVNEATGKAGKPPSLSPSEHAVKQACRHNNAQEAKNALLNWAQVCWHDQPMTNLSEIAQAVPDSLAEQINDLSTALYSDNHVDWNGQDLLTAFSAYKPGRHSTPAANDPVLEPLYKT